MTADPNIARAVVEDVRQLRADYDGALADCKYLDESR